MYFSVLSSIPWISYCAPQSTPHLDALFLFPVWGLTDRVAVGNLFWLWLLAAPLTLLWRLEMHAKAISSGATAKFGERKLKWCFSERWLEVCRTPVKALSCRNSCRCVPPRHFFFSSTFYHFKHSTHTESSQSQFFLCLVLSACWAQYCQVKVAHEPWTRSPLTFSVCARRKKLQGRPLQRR